MGDIIKYIKNFFLKQTNNLINHSKKKKNNFFFYCNFAYIDLKAKVLGIKSIEDLIFKLIYSYNCDYEKEAELLEDLNKQYTLKDNPEELKSFLKESKLKKKFNKHITKNGLFFSFYKTTFGINDILYTVDKKFYNIVDTIFVYFNYLNLNKIFFSKFYKKNPINLRLLQTKNSFQYNILNKNYKNYLNLFNFGLKSIWNSLKLWILPIFIFIFIIYYCSVVKLLPFTKILFQWFLLTMFFYWLISGFVWFFKKYQYRYYTSSIQRFWRRSFIIFWAIEAFLFCIFVYLTLNASQEPVFMYDNSQVYKNHLFSWRYFLIKLFPVTLLIVCCYFLLLSLKWNIFSKSNYFISYITILLLYIVWQEFYQFFHLMSFYGNLNWVYDIDDRLWNLEVEFRRTRIVNHYVTICLVAKFWHVIFVLVFWVFFISKCLELGRIRYPLFSANYQNFIIIYVMSWVYMYPWFKNMFKRFFEAPYYWFYVNTRRVGLFIFFVDMKLHFMSFFEDLYFCIQPYLLLLNRVYLKNFQMFDFYYWNNSLSGFGGMDHRKSYIREHIIKYIS